MVGILRGLILPADYFEANWKKVGILCAAIGFILLVHGAIPFLAVPTVGQAVWTTGFSASFINRSVLTIQATNFGAPAPARIAFGLAGAYPASLLIAAGLRAVDAYSATTAMWLTVALLGAWGISRSFGLSVPTAVLTALVWMVLPIVWGHSGYSMVSFGFALMPLYFWNALRLFGVIGVRASGRFRQFCLAAVNTSVCVLAVFMDGYTFVMFAIGSLVIAAWASARFSNLRRRLVTFGVPVHVAGLTFAYALYTTYVGRLEFEPSSLDLFRGWGVDLAFISIPTRGVLWLFDVLGWSLTRSDYELFGDESVWRTTFSLPLILAGFVAWLWLRRPTATQSTARRLATGLSIVVVFGLYMALGPTLKIGTVKPVEIRSSTPIIRTMTAGLGTLPTGSAWISEHVPGFRNMRAAYRWLGLSLLGCWLLWVGLASEVEPTWWVWLVTFGLIISGLPHVREVLRDSVAYRRNFLDMDHQLLTDLRGTLKRGERVAFLPYRNDFLINYAASRLGIRAYNIGGDKNLAMAILSWPPAMQSSVMGTIDAAFTQRVARLLARGDADAIVLPYFDGLWAAHLWPCPAEAALLFSADVGASYRNVGAKCPSELKSELDPVISALSKLSYFTVEEQSLHAVVRVRPDLRLEVEQQQLEGTILRSAAEYPIRLDAGSPSAAWVLDSGWYTPESTHVWSGRHAVLHLPVPQQCSVKNCFARLAFAAYGPGEGSRIEVNFSAAKPSKWSNVIVAARSKPHEVLIPLPKNASMQPVSIDVPQAISPKSVGESSDGRVLGILSSRIELILTN
jgi:hypothetical protein